MTLFKQKIYQRAFKGAISLVLLASLSLAVVRPQAVNTQIIDNIVIAATILNVPIIAGLDGQNTFPVSEEREPVKKISVRATAYASEFWQTDSTPCITANGFDLCTFYEENDFGNTIAANFLPLGAQVRFPELYGDKIFVVRDRMNARYGYGRVDIWLPELSEARTFGVQWLVMEVF